MRIFKFNITLLRGKTSNIVFRSNSSTNTSATTPTHRSSSGGNRSAARLGTDLLRMFLEEIETDLQISVNGRRMRAHRCILASRCQYFAAVLSGNTKSETIVPLDGFTYDAVHFGMCHIYSGASHVPDSVSLVRIFIIYTLHYEFIVEYFVSMLILILGRTCFFSRSTVP